MSDATSGRLVALGTTEPLVDPAAWVAPGAVLVGSVRLGPGASVWYGCVLRGDGDLITVGARSNLQDGSVVHCDPGRPVTVGAGVTVGHRAVLHGCTVDDDALVGMSATVLDGARIGAGSLVAAGTVVTEGMQVPPGSLVAGVPGRVRRSLRPEEREGLRRSALTYVDLAERHRTQAREVRELAHGRVDEPRA